MKFLVLVSSILAVALAHWEPVHEKYHGPLHYPKIYKGVPVEPAAVQHAREAHLKAVSEAAHNNNGYDNHEEYDSYDHHDESYHHEESQKKWHGPLHYPKIHKGVPIEPLAVQHARAEHLEAVHGHHGHESYEHQYASEDFHHGDHGYSIHQKHAPVYGHQESYHYHHEIPVIGHDGKPKDTPEVEHAKAAHFAAYHKIAHEHHH